MWENYVIDGTIPLEPGLLCFCPVELDENGEIVSLITGMNILSNTPPRGAKVIAVVHADGQDATEAFYAERKDDIDRAMQHTE